MAYDIETFSNLTGGNVLYKALTHPGVWSRATEFFKRLAAAGPTALYDPFGMSAAIASSFDLSGLNIAGVFVQKTADIGKETLSHKAQPITALPACKAKAVLVIAFNAERPITHIRHLAGDAQIVSLDEIRLPAELITNPSNYLDPLNFATNFVFFRDTDGQHTRLVTVNYWSGYGAKAARLWLRLFGTEGEILAEWTEPLPPSTAAAVIDSREIRQRFGLKPFIGQLFVHVVGAAGHDVVKYALDTYDDDAIQLSCTHDANAWPAERYAGLPAPRDGERVVLWVQNSHPRRIAKGEIGLNLMGRNEVNFLDREIAPFGSYPLDVAELLPHASWPQQIEIRAGKHFVRPRYEVITKSGRRRIAHPNVERTDLKPDPNIPGLAALMGKGYLLPAPILPVERWRSSALPTPMSLAQSELPIAINIYDANGDELVRKPLGSLQRAEIFAIDAGRILRESRTQLPSGYGHMEILYDFGEGGVADGWLHALFRYEDEKSTHAAETSFGAHIFNTALTYKDEPQSYSGKAPGLSTRLFLRLGPAPLDTMCHLIYPASTPWHAHSETDLILCDGLGAEVERQRVRIACGGSLHWRYSEMFGEEAGRKAGDKAFVIVRDVTCRLFGYHGLLSQAGSFSLDHMFGF